jgi:23S rRNA pseudouridine1911/1915/1917 synthase
VSASEDVLRVVEEASPRLDRWLAEATLGLSRAAAMKLVASGKVLVNGRRAKKGQPLEAGDEVRIQGGVPAHDWSPRPSTEVALRVVHEDADVVVVEKPAGVPTHPLEPEETGTVANALVARWPEMAGVGYSPREPGIVHRLDTDTSGLLLCARNEVAFRALRDALRGGEVRKEYMALVAGDVSESGRVLGAIAPHQKDRRRVEVIPEQRRRRRPEAKLAETRYEVLQRYGGTFTLLRVRASPALRHQVRVHLASAGHPIAGDALYGGPAIEGLTRHFLHAEALAFMHPRTGKPLRLVSHLPADLDRALKAI